MSPCLAALAAFGVITRGSRVRRRPNDSSGVAHSVALSECSPGWPAHCHWQNASVKFRFSANGAVSSRGTCSLPTIRLLVPRPRVHTRSQGLRLRVGRNSKIPRYQVHWAFKVHAVGGSRQCRLGVELRQPRAAASHSLSQIFCSWFCSTSRLPSSSLRRCSVCTISLSELSLRPRPSTDTKRLVSTCSQLIEGARAR